MRRIIGGVIVAAGVVLMLTAFLFTVGLPVAVIGLIVLLWPRKTK